VNTASAPGFVLFDLSAEEQFRWSGVSFTGFLRVQNLFDRAVVGSVIVNEANGRYYEPSPGRAWIAGVETVLVPSGMGTAPGRRIRRSSGAGKAAGPGGSEEM
jgi:hypothetical protein